MMRKSVLVALGLSVSLVSGSVDAAGLIDTLWKNGILVEFRQPEQRDVFSDKIRKGVYDGKERKISVVMFNGVEIEKVLRHEAWHAAQQCNGRDGGIFREILTDKEVVDNIREEDFRSVLAMYPVQVVRLELEAKIAEDLSDETIIKVVEGLCQ